MKKIETKPKICEQCGEKFERRDGGGIKKWNKRRFCCYQCYWESLRGRVSKKRKGEMIRCEKCGKKFYSPLENGPDKFCSRECYFKHHKVRRKKVECETCGKIFKTTEQIDKKYCSRKCYNVDRYYSETRVIKFARKFLGDNGEREKEFEGLINDNGNSLRIDVYFPKYNLAIEYNGQQHYEYVEKFSNRLLEEVQRSDELKREYCEKNNINLLTVKYTQDKTYENISNLIKQCLKKKK